MSNLLVTLEKGKKGFARGLPTGVKDLDSLFLGVQRQTYYGIFAGPGAGKTTFTDFVFVLSVCDYAEKNNLNLKIKYYSYEISRIKKEFKLACYFFFKDYSIRNFTHNGKKYDISPNYLMGKLLDDEENLISIKPEHEKILKEIYHNKIVKIFGTYDESGKKIKDGYVDIVNDSSDPVGIYNEMYQFAEERGTIVKEKYYVKDANGNVKERYRACGYKPNDPNEMVVVIIDHMRKVRQPKGYNQKQTLDDISNRLMKMRDIFGYSPVAIIHSNRNLSNIDRIKYQKGSLYPDMDDIKDSGNIAEDVDVLISLFNPTEEKYNIQNHFGWKIKKTGTSKNDITFNNYMKNHFRSLHLVKSRDTPFPKHFFLYMFGNINYFLKAEKKS